MSRYHSYLNSAKQILQQYNGEEPFASFLKKYFSANKKFGSKDRKQVSQLCYCFFRSAPPLSKGGIREALSDLKEKILTGLFLCSNQTNEILSLLKPEWNEKVKLPLPEKLLSINYQVLSLFSWKEELSTGIDFEKFSNSFLVQPDLFLRLRPGKEKIVKQKLQDAGILFESVSASCLSLPNSSKIEVVIELDKEAIIQDYNSQRIGEFLQPEFKKFKSKISLWDCCAGSGGKSIMAYDLHPSIELTVSDKRETILINLKKRFENAGIKKYKSFICDLTVQFPIPTSQFQLILCDAPCTGSGTWSRTPEQLYFFDKSKIEEYASLQKRIVSNAISHLQPGGIFIYITCSVFKKENEENVEFITKNFQLKLMQMEVLKGYDKKADSMFVALLKKED